MPPNWFWPRPCRPNWPGCWAGGTEHITVSVEDFNLEGWGEVYDREIKGNPQTILPPSYDWDSEYLRLTGKPRK